MFQHLNLSGFRETAPSRGQPLLRNSKEPNWEHIFDVKPTDPEPDVSYMALYTQETLFLCLNHPCARCQPSGTSGDHFYNLEPAEIIQTS